MGVKKRNKANAEFNMSSLTDIIFLLLIFFMLTSGVVSPNALNLQLPGKSRTSLPPSSVKIDEVGIEPSGGFFLNRRAISFELLENQMQSLVETAAPEKAKIFIAPATGTPVEHVVKVMDMAMRLKIDAILSTEDRPRPQTPGTFKFNR